MTNKPTFITDAVTWTLAIQSPPNYSRKPSWSDEVRHSLIKRLQLGQIPAVSTNVLDLLRQQAGLDNPSDPCPMPEWLILQPEEIPHLETLIHLLTAIRDRHPEMHDKWEERQTAAKHDDLIRRIRADMVTSELRKRPRSRSHEDFARLFFESKWLSNITEFNDRIRDLMDSDDDQTIDSAIKSFNDLETEIWQKALPKISEDGTSKNLGKQKVLLDLVRSRDEIRNMGNYRFWPELHLLLYAQRFSNSVVTSANPYLSTLGLLLATPVIPIHGSCNAGAKWDDLKASLLACLDNCMDPSSPLSEGDSPMEFESDDDKPKSLSELLAAEGLDTP